MDLHENGEKNLVTASFEFPGATKEDIQIEIHNGKLTVSAETKQSTEHDENGYAVRERRFGKYSRTLQLPQGVKVCQLQFCLINSTERFTVFFRTKRFLRLWTMASSPSRSPSPHLSWRPRRSRFRRLVLLCFTPLVETAICTIASHHFRPFELLYTFILVDT